MSFHPLGLVRVHPTPAEQMSQQRGWGPNGTRGNSVQAYSSPKKGAKRGSNWGRHNQKLERERRGEGTQSKAAPTPAPPGTTDEPSPRRSGRPSSSASDGERAGRCSTASSSGETRQSPRPASWGRNAQQVLGGEPVPPRGHGHRPAPPSRPTSRLKKGFKNGVRLLPMQRVSL